MPRRALMIIAPEDFRDEEYDEPRRMLEEAGIGVVTASLTSAAVSKAGRRQRVDITLDECGSNYDAIVFVGGPGATLYFRHSKAHMLAQEMEHEGKVLAAICIAPSVLANAGVLKGKRVTSWPSQKVNLREHGAEWVDEPVVVDGKVVTANGPDASRAFGSAIAKLLTS
ncbi:DJ-1/PfpI family protein [Candidatus Woesearchaeota archaeon]|nr:DJ-1/PfpI family protein [Candidatus Woesearchaeota archaeon]